jgi:hypothetical protein
MGRQRKTFSLIGDKNGLEINLDDEFLIYLKEKIGNRLLVSYENIDLLLWGVRDSGSVKLLGLTLAIGVEKPETVTKHELRQLSEKADTIMRVTSSLSKNNDLTFFIVLYPLLGGPSFKVTDPANPLSLEQSFVVEEYKMPNLFAGFFKTKLRSSGTAKRVNKSTSDWFHDWTRANLPTEYVKANIDGLVLNEKGKPTILLETKRSFFKPSLWEPYQADSRNYYLQGLLARITNLSFWTVYHEKGVSVKDDSDIALFIILAVAPDKKDWINYRRFDISATEVLKMLGEKCRQ